MNGKEISPPVYVLVVKPENLRSLSLYINNMKSLGLVFENVPGKTVSAVFIKVSITRLALEHFSQLFDIGIDEKADTYRPYLLGPIFYCLFSTPVSQQAPRRVGEFLSCEVIMIVNKVLESTKFTHRDNDRGMSKLIRRGILMDGYPLHDGPATENGYNQRSLLLRFWSNASSVHREQPLDLIQRYFGHEIAFYFAWLEYFNLMLVVPSVLGAVVFLIGLIRVTFYPIEEVKEICSNKDSYICPTCEKRSHCKFAKMSSFCSMSQWTYVFDNQYTVAFAFLMSIWATLFLTLWKRVENLLKIRWNANIEVEDEEAEIREVYRENAKHKRYNRRTGEVEPYTPQMKNIFNYSITFFACIFMVTIMLLLVTLNIATGIEFRSFISRYGNDYLKKNKIIFPILVGSFIQVMYIKLMSLFFGPLSIKLTNLENPRTQHDYDNSVLYKRYILAFVNNLSPVFYLAFIKGKLYTVPHENKLYISQDVCQPQSCIVPLCIQITFLLTLRSFAGNLANIIYPRIKWMLREVSCTNRETVIVEQLPQWEEEYFLQPSGRYLLTSEFSEMIIKYCLVTFFVAAFPLAPLCALVNNLWELRSDAYKLVKIHRRPLPVQKNSIGAWNGILLSMTFISTATNAFVIAFTSDFIPDRVYHFTDDVSKYYDYILSKYATKDYPLYQNLDNHAEYCLYRGHYNPPDGPNAYQYDTFFWLNFASKFIAILIFEHVIFVFNAILSYSIPKLPESVGKYLNVEKLNEKKEMLKEMESKNEKQAPSVRKILRLDF